MAYANEIDTRFRAIESRMHQVFYEFNKFRPQDGSYKHLELIQLLTMNQDTLSMKVDTLNESLDNNKSLTNLKFKRILHQMSRQNNVINNLLTMIEQLQNDNRKLKLVSGELVDTSMKLISYTSYIDEKIELHTANTLRSKLNLLWYKIKYTVKDRLISMNPFRHSGMKYV